MFYRLRIAILFFVAAFFGGVGNASAQAGLPSVDTCKGEFLNPLSDICWECLGPLTIGSLKVTSSDKYDYGNPGNPICYCGGLYPGIAIGFWEPSRLLDMTREPWCFPNLGGIKLDPGIGFPGGVLGNSLGNNHLEKWHAHYYVYPVLSLLQIITDVLCTEVSGFDLGYVTELDPLWNSDGLSLLIHPEAIIFANPVAIAACTVDCGSSVAKRPRRELFWCMGCNQGVYPMNGNISGDMAPARAAISIAQRMTFKLHRQSILLTNAGSDNLCSPSPEPVMDKRQYRYQLTQPKAITSGPFTCPNMGFPTSTYEAGTGGAIRGSDYGVLLFKKRNCCAL